MTKQHIIASLIEKHEAFGNLINGLDENEYLQTRNGKWSAAQQIEHIILCLTPLVKVFSMDKEFIAQTFGRSNKAGRSYDGLITEYKAKLNQGGKAPDKYVPDASISIDREAASTNLINLIVVLSSKIETFSEEELDSLLIPHPLLGNLTLREMLYNALYHVEHHQNQIAH